MLIRASLMLMMLAWGGASEGAENVVNTLSFACCAKNCSKNSSLWLPCMHAAPNLGESVFFLRKPSFRRVLGVCFATFGPPPPSR